MSALEVVTWSSLMVDMGELPFRHPPEIFTRSWRDNRQKGGNGPIAQHHNSSMQVLVLQHSQDAVLLSKSIV